MAEILIGSINKGKAEGVAELDDHGTVPSTQLPGHVENVLEFANLAGFPATGETGKIYIATDTNKIYRWGGTGYTEISPSLALGTTSATAFRGDQGKTAYDHSQAKGNPHNLIADDIVKAGSNIELGTDGTISANVAGSALTSVVPIAKGGTGAITSALAANNIQTWYLGVGGTNIVANSDLNILITYGNYCCTLANTARTIKISRVILQVRS